MAARVPSVEPSSTTMSSSTRVYKRSSTSATVASSLNAGTTARRRGSPTDDIRGGATCHVPFERPVHPCGDVDGGAPAQQVNGAFAHHDARRQVSGSGRSELH